MNVEEFYDEDPRRRRSAEVALGHGWTMDSDPYVLYGLHWIEETGEIYVVRGPQMPVAADALDPDVAGLFPAGRHAYEAIVLGTAESEDVLRDALAGWELAMPEPNSLQWVRQRLWDAAS